MKKLDQDEGLDPEQRVRQMQVLFRGVCNTLSAMIAAEDELTPKELRYLNAKLSELETLHTSLSKAEEAFHEKCRANGSVAKPDYDAIRDQIGSALDRIRIINRTGGIS